MSDRSTGSQGYGFPMERPDIQIVRLEGEPFAVDCPELLWWFGIPRAGEQAAWAVYDSPEWRLTSTRCVKAMHPARIHDLDCVELTVDESTGENGLPPSNWTMFARLTERTVQWIATSVMVEGVRILRSFLDEGFEADWGERCRRLWDGGRYVPEGAEESYTIRSNESTDAPGAIGAGLFSVTVGMQEFRCLRVLDLDQPDESGTLMEGYLTSEGRTVLCRRYNGRQWALNSTWTDRAWDERFPDHHRITIAGATYVHWYDCLSGVACGASG